MSRIAVIGAGAWGTALAHVAATAGNQVSLIGRDRATIDAINKKHRHPSLGEASLDARITARTDFEATADAIIVAVPAQETRAALTPLASGLAGKPVILSAKGLERGSGLRQSEVLSAVVPAALPLVLSGPSFAADVAASKPTAVTLAAHDAALADRIAALLAGPAFRPYAAGDVAGVEIAGALKNVFALACGAVEGAGLGLSARSAVLARSFAELSRLVVALGGEAATLNGLAGIGDLTLTCTTRQSRNYDHGYRLGAGEAPAAVLAEGVHTAPVALMLAQQAKIDAPITGAVNALISGRARIADLVEALMTRPLRREGEN
jgi:glycerol-3-phosphate dehydrogenase (NAD(P)+)